MKTIVRFPSGEITVDLWMDQVRDLIQEGLARGVLVELEAPDGRKMILNPQQVETIFHADRP